ncbi:MAG: hypothetical protein AAF125_01855 [Chloroflexota bacterium]
MITEDHWQSAREDFGQLYWRGIMGRIWTRLRRKQVALVDIRDAAENVQRLQIVDRGIQTIRVDAIYGSTQRNSNFDMNFRPTRRRARNRWSRIRTAYFEDKTLPAIEVVRFGEQYFVADGHHRVSVAKFLGQVFIDAHVTDWIIANNNDCSCLGASTTIEGIRHAVYYRVS